MSRYCMILNMISCVMFLLYWGNVYLTELPCPSFASVMAVQYMGLNLRGVYLFYTIIFPYSDIQTNC